jgi:hypothetical protein
MLFAQHRPIPDFAVLICDDPTDQVRLVASEGEALRERAAAEIRH